MEKSKRLAWIDNFKWIAALLVAANHTSPLESVWITADFLLTRVLARLAVPFFFMVTGYFVLAPACDKTVEHPKGKASGNYNRKKVLESIKKTGLLYLAATAVYLPIQLYKWITDRPENSMAGNVLKAVLFDGTYYHLWYLPAVMLGLGIVILLLKYLPGQAMAVCIGLYAIGLLGDSYYGMTAGIPLFKSIYDGIFTVFSYTRNGFFMAPVFLLLGRRAALEKREEKPGRDFRNFVITLIFLCAEGLILHKGDMQRHDSMYLILPVCMWYLFCFLASEKQEGNKKGRFFYEGPMLFYILHPFAILAVRGFVKITGLTFFLTVSPLYYMAVVICGLGGSYLVLWGRQFISKKQKGQSKALYLRKKAERQV